MLLHDIQRRIRQVGEIRMGTSIKKTGTKGEYWQPVKLSTWRLTSTDRVLLEACAKQFGGQVKVWERKSGKSEVWELVTKTNSIMVGLPPHFLDQAYEEWSGGECVKRCDGREMTVADKAKIEKPCPCACRASGKDRVCKPISRIRVILPGLGIGLWRLVTTGYNAAAELGGLYELIGAKPGLATITLERREKVDGGKTIEYYVPVIGMQQIAADFATLVGQERFALEADGHVQALPAPSDFEEEPPEVPENVDQQTGEIPLLEVQPAPGKDWPIFGEEVDAVLKKAGLVNAKLAREFIKDHEVSASAIAQFKGESVADLMEHVEKWNESVRRMNQA